MKGEKIVEHYYHYTVQQNKEQSLESFLNQVGKTFLGKTIDQNTFNVIVETIIYLLNIHSNDSVIDLGCANGLLSYQIAKKCRNVIGFDLSEDLLNIAKINHTRDNIVYINEDILKINFKKLSISKIYMYEVLQHIDYKDFRVFLHKCNEQMTNFSFFIGSIPNAQKLFQFYNTKERKKYYFNEVLEKGIFHIGHWWHREQIEYLCEDLGLKCQIIEQDKRLHTAHYRFDCLIKKV